MANTEVLLPKMGESVAEATITTWLKGVGDTVEAEESIVEIATDKVDSEVPSPASGVIQEIKFEEGDVAQVGEVIAVIATEGGAQAPASTPAATPEPAVAAAAKEATAIMDQGQDVAAKPAADFSAGSRFYSPLVKTIAQKEGISLEELESISGTGNEGRVTKSDILGYIENRGNAPTPVAAAPEKPSASAPAAPKPAPTPKPTVDVAATDGNVEIIEMDRMRKIIAKNMIASKQTSAHVTSFVEADITNMVNWRNKNKKAFQEREGAKLTFTPLLIECIVKAIKDFPLINVSVDGDRILRKKGINIGMAAALPSGNLIVPVIHNADNYNLIGLAKKVNDLAGRARINKLTPDEIQGGTYTISNVGSFGNVMGTPIIPQPQVAIMAVGTIQKKPAVIETPDGDFIGIRHKMFLSHTYDHRVVDGALGGMFVRRVADYIEAFDTQREI